MRTKLQILSAILALTTSAPAFAVTVAQWRWEGGPANANVPHAGAAGAFDGTIPDVSGNGNSLSVWETGGGAGYAYRSDIPYPNIPTLGLTNSFSVKNTGGGPAMFTTSSVALPSGIDIETMTPTAFTVEASYKPENGGYRTVVGRDARNVATSNGDLAALYLQIQPDNRAAIKFTDLSGAFYEAISAPGLIQGFNFPTDNEGLTGTWYNLAGVCDGNTLKLYVNSALVATTTLAAPSTGLAIGTTSGGDWHAGEWSVGRGLYAGGHGDRAYGFIDEVRISNSALDPSQFLYQPTSLQLLVDKITGAVTLKNNSANAAVIDFYKIASPGNALNFAGWNSLDDQNFNALDGGDVGTVAGDSPSEGWDEGGASGTGQLLEYFLKAGGSSIAANQTLSLGNAFDVTKFGSGMDGDLTFNFALAGGVQLTGTVTYVVSGDLTGDGKVNGADFIAWQRGLGTTYNANDLANIRANYGAGGGVPVAGSVPEPAAAALFVIAIVGAAVARRPNWT